MSLPASTFKRNILASTIGLVLISSSANLMATVITANVDYSLNGGGVTNDNETSSTTPSSVNLIAGDSDSTANVFYHTYGSTNGNFGSRVDGSGTFDITGQFTLVDTYTNNTGNSQNINLDFTIIAGEVANNFDALTAGQSLFSMYNIDVMVDLNQDGTYDNTLFHSSVEVSSDDTGSNLTTTGTMLTGSVNNTGIGFNSLSWQQHSESLFVGSILAGESFDLRYVLTTTATGIGLNSSGCGGEPNAADGNQTALVVEGPGDGDGNGGGCNSAISRIGDPLNFSGQPGQPTNTFSISVVSAPTSLAFLGLGFSAMFLNNRRKLKINN